MTGHIVTLTFSPTIDLATSTDIVAATHKLRCTPAVAQPGGGGVNVARVATRLNARARAVVPVGGASGSELARLLAAEQLDAVTVEVANSTRQNFSVNERATGDQFRFVLPAPPLAAAEVAAMLDATVDACDGARCLVLSGQVPDAQADQVVSKVVERVAPVPVIVDTSGAALAGATRSAAALVKPSARELGSLVGHELRTEDDILRAAVDLCDTSPLETLVVSIGAGGAFAVSRDHGVMRCRAPAVRVVSAIGAGDSLVAGIAVAVSRGAQLDDALRLGIAAGSATVMSSGTDLCDPADVERLVDLVQIEPVVGF